MDKVQFNTQMVNMRKTVKRAKVQLIHRLTRQIVVIRKKKGSGKQIVKNERRAGRLVKEIEVIKDLPCDELTMSAVINKQSLQDVLDNPNSTAVERGTARLIHHRLISHQVATFKDLVTDDLLEIGKRKEKLMSRAKEGTARKTEKPEKQRREVFNEDEEEEEDGSSAECSNAGESSDDEMSISPSMETMDAGRSTKSESSSLSEQNQRLREQMEGRHKKSGFFLTAQSKSDTNIEEESYSVEEEDEDDDDDDDDDDDEGSLEDMDDDLDEMGENFNAEFRELTAEFRKERNNSSGQVEKEKKKSKGLDSLFVGKLSGKSQVSSDRKDKSKKNRPGQKERQKMNIKNQLNVLRRPSKKEAGEGSRHVALVDLPSLDAREGQPSKRKVIPGINSPFEKPKTADSANAKLLPSQRSMAFPVSKRGRGGARGGGRGGGGGGRTFLQPPAEAPEVLHPSWEAKKKKKEQESKILPFTGKKITFDD